MINIKIIDSYDQNNETALKRHGVVGNEKTYQNRLTNQNNSNAFNQPSYNENDDSLFDSDRIEGK